MERGGDRQTDRPEGHGLVEPEKDHWKKLCHRNIASEFNWLGALGFLSIGNLCEIPATRCVSSDFEIYQMAITPAFMDWQS